MTRNNTEQLTFGELRTDGGQTTTDADGPDDDGTESITAIDPETGETDDVEEIPDAVADAGTLLGEFEFKGLNAEPYIEDDSPEATGPFYYWKRDSDSMVGVYENDEYDGDGYPFTAAKWVNPKGENPYWKHTHIAESWEDAVHAARNTADHRIFIVESERGETYPEWEERTGGTGYEHPVTVPWEESDDDDVPAFDLESATVSDEWVGEFLATSWGYGQTNVDVVQIVDVSDSGKTVLARMATVDRDATHRTSESVGPTPDSETYGDEFRLYVRECLDDVVFRGSYPYIDGETDTGTRTGSFDRIEVGQAMHQTAPNAGH